MEQWCPPPGIAEKREQGFALRSSLLRHFAFKSLIDDTVENESLGRGSLRGAERLELVGGHFREADLADVNERPQDLKGFGIVRERENFYPMGDLGFAL